MNAPGAFIQKSTERHNNAHSSNYDTVHSDKILLLSVFSRKPEHLHTPSLSFVTVAMDCIAVSLQLSSGCYWLRLT